MPSYTPVTALLRGLEVLRQTSRMGRATVSALCRETGEDKATIIRMLETLIHAGYVTRDAEAGGYRVTGRVLQLSAGFDRGQQVSALAAPVLARFRAQIGWPSDFALRDGDAMILVGTSREPGPLFFNRQPGFRAPMLATSLGRAYLAHCPAPEQAEILRLLAPAAGAAAKETEAMLPEIRRAGFAVMAEDYSQAEYGGTLWAMAVPVMDEGRVWGALNIMLLRQAVTVETARETYLPALRQAAAELARAFCDGGL